MSAIRCCVLGASGFIGGQIVRAALAEGLQVRAVRRRPNAAGAIEDLNVEWVIGDLSDPASLVTAMRGCPLAFHAAGYYPRHARDIHETMAHGVSGMRNVISAAATAGVKRLIYTSALTTIGPPSDPNQLATETDMYTPGTVPNPYFEVKWAMEMEAMRATAQGFPVIIVLPTATFGPGDVKPTTSTLLLRVAQGGVPGYVDGILNVADGRDVAIGHIAAARRGQPGKRYILGGHNLPIKEVLAIAARTAGRKPPRVKFSPGMVRLVAKVGSRLRRMPGIYHLLAIDSYQAINDAQSRKELELSAPIPFEQTCFDTLLWFHERGLLKRRPVPVVQAAAEAGEPQPVQGSAAPNA
jgi:dihydroflavonol-4-reductase